MFTPEEIVVDGVGVEARLGINEFGVFDAQSTLGKFVEEVKFFFRDGAFWVCRIDFGAGRMDTEFDEIGRG